MYTIVVPTIREDSIRRFLTEWAFEFANHHVIVIEDNPTKTFKIKGGNVDHYSWAEIDHELGENRWIIPRRSDAIRNFGFLKAKQDNPDMIVTLDDDCYPWRESSGEVSFLQEHWRQLNRDSVPGPVFDTMFALGLDIKPRGFPKYSARETVLNHGLWNGVPDLDGETQEKTGVMQVTFKPHSLQIPFDTYFPMCGMNVAFKPKILPAMYFLPMGEGQPYHRFADIWCGLIAKTVCDSLWYGVRSGSPFIYHSRASDAKKNKQLEKTGMKMNERVWEVVSGAALEGKTVSDCTFELVDYVSTCIRTVYWQRTLKAYRVWIDLLSAS